MQNFPARAGVFAREHGQPDGTACPEEAPARAGKFCSVTKQTAPTEQARA